MGRYDSITPWLRGLEGETVTVTFAELEEVTGPLPPSARSNRTWWGNSPRHPHAAAWLAAQRKVVGVDLASETVTFASGAVTRRIGTGRAPILDGIAALVAMTERAGWPTLKSAVAAHCVFLDPATVAQSGGRAIVPAVRRMSQRGDIGELNGRAVIFDDNTTPTDVFLWAADRVKGPDVQFNHVWTCAQDPDAYTALWNLCCTPAFLAKATDTHAGVRELLRFRAWDLYGHRPAGQPEPVRPESYDILRWASSPSPVEDLESLLRRRMAAAPRRRATVAARTIGWAFSRGPDPAL